MLRSITLAFLLAFALLAVMILFGVNPTSLLPAPQTALANAAGALITVTTTSDDLIHDGNCSLREAIQAAGTDAAVDQCPAGAGSDTLYLPAGLYPLTSGQLTLTSNITLQGSITATTILDGQSQDRVLTIQPETEVVLMRLEIRNGLALRDDPENCCDYVGEGGGILNYGTTTIAGSIIHANQAGSWYFPAVGLQGENGGGIYNGGVLTVTNSTISGNHGGTTATGESHGGEAGCGHAGEGGGIANAGTLVLDNVTIANNESGRRDCYPYPDLTIGAVGGLYNEDSGTVLMRNSIVASNQGSDCRGAITALGNNVIETTDGCTISGEFVHWAARLGSIADHGGATLTYALDAKSPAIDAGSCTDSAGITVTVDQRGEPRPQGEGCDIGAFESPYTSTFAIGVTSLPQIAYHPPFCTDASAVCNLTNSLQRDRSPSWSPDGQRIAFMRAETELLLNSALYVMNADGSQQTKLADLGYLPKWSPNGNKIAFTVVDDNNWELYEVDTSGGAAVNLTNSLEAREDEATWSPDGSKLLYHYYQEVGDQNPDIYVMNADGSQKTLLAIDSVARGWSPDSSRILYTHLAAYKEFHIIGADGSNRIDITSAAGTWYRSPSWSPDGSKIASECDVPAGAEQERRLCVMNSDGSNRLSFSVNGLLAFSPVWAPQGNKIAFFARLPSDFSTSELWVMNSDGSELANLTKGADNFTLVWSPDGNRLLFKKDYLSQGGGYEYSLIHADGSNERRLTNTPSYKIEVGDAVWSPDSRSIAIVSGVTGNDEIYLFGLGQ